MKDYNYKVLRPMLCAISTDNLLFPTWGVRMGEGALPWNGKVGTHAFFIIQSPDGKFWAVGMNGDGFDIDSLYNWLGMKDGSRIVKLIDHPAWDDANARQAANNFLWEAANTQKWQLFDNCERRIRYDWKAFFSFLDPTHRIAKGDPKQPICSEVMNPVCQKFTGKNYIDKETPSPWDLQRTSWPEVKNFIVEV